MNRLLRRALLGASGVALGAALIWLSYFPGGLLWLELLVTSPEALSGILFWTGAVVIGFSLGGWEFMLTPLRVISYFRRRRTHQHPRKTSLDEKLFFQVGDHFQVDDDYFERIGGEPAHPKYRTRRPHKTLDDIPEYKQQIELPNYAERAEDSPDAEMEMGDSDNERRIPARNDD